MNPKNYKYQSPLHWLYTKIEDANEQEARRLATVLAAKLDFNTIQDIFQDEMEKDGYFQEVKE